jgi:hypothetical protein
MYDHGELARLAEKKSHSFAEHNKVDKVTETTGAAALGRMEMGRRAWVHSFTTKGFAKFACGFA